MLSAPLCRFHLPAGQHAAQRRRWGDHAQASIEAATTEPKVVSVPSITIGAPTHDHGSVNPEL